MLSLTTHRQAVFTDLGGRVPATQLEGGDGGVLRFDRLKAAGLRCLLLLLPLLSMTLRLLQ